MKVFRSRIARLSVLAVLSAALYVVLFLFIEPLGKLFTGATVLGAFAVILAAMLFSLVHGSFASELLGALGLGIEKRQGH